MRIRFGGGGPWDGVEFETSYFPNQIGFRNLQEAIEDAPGAEMAISTSKVEHHQYLLKGRTLKEAVELKVGENLKREPGEGEDICDLVDDDLLIMFYEYAPGKKVWWDELPPKALHLLGLNLAIEKRGIVPGIPAPSKADLPCPSIGRVV